MDSDNENGLFKAGELPLVSGEDLSMSESDDDLNSFADDQLDQLNVSSTLKNILRMGAHEVDVSLDADDSESDDDLFHKKINSIDIDKLNEKLQKSKLKFKDFGAEEEEDEEEEVQVKRKRPRKSMEKKRRRDKGKEKANILQAQQETRADNLDRVLSRFKEEASDDEDVIVSTKSKKKSGRKTRKKTSDDTAIDENGERMLRTTTLVDSSSSSEDEKPLSKKEQEEMYRENERLRRNKKVGLKPVYNVKTFDDFIKRRELREKQYLEELEKQQEKSTMPTPATNDDSDSDIEIIGDPKKIAASLFSPEQSRYPIHLSPVKPKSSFKEFNRRMLEKITNERYEYRIKMEAAAKARGQYASATERAKRLLEREKDAVMINQQINQHFEKQKQDQADDNDSDIDEDYEEEEGVEEDDILNELSGSEDEFEVEEAEDENSKRKIDETSDEDDMATGAFKRWKNKKIKKSIFEDDDDDEHVATTKKKATQKPEPKHSIANFFKAKENEKSEEKPVKPLNRLVQKEEEKEPDIQSEEDDNINQDDNVSVDTMDIDENIPEPTDQKQPEIQKQKLEYFEEEAEEEEDEFYGVGGSDGEGDENLDEFEKDDLLVEESNEHVDEATLRHAFNKIDEESDHNMIQRLITDIAGGGLRKQKAAAEAGIMLEDVDLYDEEDNDLVAIRRIQAAKRRKLLKSRGGDALDNLLKDPKTAAFAKAFQAIPEDTGISFLSDDEVEEDEDEDKKQNATEEKPINNKRIIIEEDEDEDEDEKKDIMDNFSDDDNLLIIDEVDEMLTPLRGGLVMDDEDVDSFQVETMTSPLAARKAKSIFSSPSHLHRFKRLIAETSNAVNGTGDSGGPLIGFGSVKNFK